VPYILHTVSLSDTIHQEGEHNRTAGFCMSSSPAVAFIEAAPNRPSIYQKQLSLSFPLNVDGISMFPPSPSTSHFLRLLYKLLRKIPLAMLNSVSTGIDAGIVQKIFLSFRAQVYK